MVSAEQPALQLNLFNWRRQCCTACHDLAFECALRSAFAMQLGPVSA